MPHKFLGENTDLYGKQRMFGSVGWGITMFLMGMALDNSTEFPDHPCGAHEGERNYLTCFTIFTVLMAAAFLAATQFRFEYDLVGNPELETDQMLMKQWYDNGPRPIFNTAPPINAPQPDKKFEFIDRWKVELSIFSYAFSFKRIVNNIFCRLQQLAFFASRHL